MRRNLRESEGTRGYLKDSSLKDGLTDSLAERHAERLSSITGGTPAALPKLTKLEAIPSIRSSAKGDVKGAQHAYSMCASASSALRSLQPPPTAPMSWSASTGYSSAHSLTGSRLRGSPANMMSPTFRGSPAQSGSPMSVGKSLSIGASRPNTFGASRPNTFGASRPTTFGGMPWSAHSEQFGNMGRGASGSPSRHASRLWSADSMADSLSGLSPLMSPLKTPMTPGAHPGMRRLFSRSLEVAEARAHTGVDVAEVN